MANNTGYPSDPNRFDPPHKGIAAEARKAIGCDGEYAQGDCFANVPEPNDYDLCPRCHLAWRIDLFENEATDWWHELGVLDGKLGFANGEKNALRDALMLYEGRTLVHDDTCGTDPCGACYAEGVAQEVLNRGR